MEWMSQVDYWHWLILAVLLICIEMLVIPAAYCLWMGIAAAIVGAMLLFAPDVTFLVQIIVFTVFSVTTLVIHKRYLKLNPVETDAPTLNRRGEQYVGRVFTLDEAIVNGVGKVRVDDSTWKVSGEDMDAGARIRVTGVDGTILKVEAAG